jgi:hypothetical protein
MFDDDFGLDDGDLDLEGEVSESRIQRLVEGKRRLEAKMAVSGPRKQRRIARYLSRIEKVLDKTGYAEAAAAGQLAAATAGIEGVDGMVFEKQPSPGPGRLKKAKYISTVSRKPLVDGVDGLVFENQPPPGPGRLSRGQTDYSALYMILGIEAPSDPRIHPLRVVRGELDK